MLEPLVKYRMITLQKGAANARAIDAIKRIQGVVCCQHKSNSLYIGYDPNQCGYQYIYSQLRRQGLLCRQTRLQRLQQCLISFMERNECAYARTPGGWDYYLQLLYLSSDSTGTRRDE